ncbi:MAG TPA: hypothetical protein VIK39_01410 [Candidatus Angelobacter sp.]
MIETTESVAAVLEQELIPTILRWMKRVDKVPELTKISLSYRERTGHLPRLIEDLITRLRSRSHLDCPATTSAHDHGQMRFEQGYSVPMLVRESRLLQVSIFDTLRIRQNMLDPGNVLIDVVTIGEECDAQLKHIVEAFRELEQYSRRAA